MSSEKWYRVTSEDGIDRGVRLWTDGEVKDWRDAGNGAIDLEWKKTEEDE